LEKYFEKVFEPLRKTMFPVEAWRERGAGGVWCGESRCFLRGEAGHEKGKDVFGNGLSSVIETMRMRWWSVASGEADGDRVGTGY